MDMDQLQHLTAEQKARYQTLDRMFGSDGWALVVAWAAAQFEAATQEAANAKTWEQNRVANGQRLAFAQLGSLALATENEYIALAEQNSEAKFEADIAEFT